MTAVGVELKPMQDFIHVISMATALLAPCHFTILEVERCHFTILEVDRFYKTKPNETKPKQNKQEDNYFNKFIPQRDT